MAGGKINYETGHVVREIYIIMMFSYMTGNCNGTFHFECGYFLSNYKYSKIFIFREI